MKTNKRVLSVHERVKLDKVLRSIINQWNVIKINSAGSLGKYKTSISHRVWNFDFWVLLK